MTTSIRRILDLSRLPGWVVSPKLRALWLLSTLSIIAVFAMGASLYDPIRNSLPPPAPPLDTSFDDVLFWDNFSNDLSAWSPDQDGVWSVQGGMLRADLPDRKNVHSFLYAGDEDWTDYALDFEVLAMRGVDKGAAVRVDGDKGVGVDLRGLGYHDVLMHRGVWRLGQAEVINTNGMWHHVRIETRGQHYRVWVNEELLIDKRDGARGRTNGRIALAAYTGGFGQCTIYFDNVVVHKLDPPDDVKIEPVAGSEKTE